jgi:hypothetical protein
LLEDAWCNATKASASAQHAANAAQAARRRSARAVGVGVLQARALQQQLADATRSGPYKLFFFDLETNGLGGWHLRPAYPGLGVGLRVGAQ